MAKNHNPQQVAADWATKLGNATQSYTQGVQGVQVSPGQVANSRIDQYLSGVQAAVANGTYQAGNNSYTLSQWQAQTVQKGAPRLASGAQAAKSKMQNFMTQYLPQVSNIVSQLPARGSYEQNKQRSSQMQDALHALKGSFKQG